MRGRDWYGAVKQAREVLRGQESSGRRAEAAAAMVRAFRGLHDYKSCLSTFQEYRELILENCSFKASKKAVLACCESLQRLGMFSDLVELADSLPRRYVKSPSVSGMLQAALLYSDAGRSLVAAQNALARSEKEKTLYMGRLAFALLAQGTSPQEVEQVIRNWKSIKLGPGEILYRGGYLDAALASRLGLHDVVLENLNKEFENNGLVPLALKNPLQGFKVDNLHSSTAAAVQEGPMVTVLMPAFNASEHIRTAVDAVLGQTHFNLELIIVNDHSSDETLEKALKYRERDSRVRVFSLAENRGPYVARNVGLVHARGDYIAVHDSDDFSHPQRLEMQLKWILEKGACACMTGWVRADDKGRVLLLADGRILHRDLSSMIFSRHVFETLGFFDHVRASGDSEYLHRITSYFGAENVLLHTGTCLALGRLRPDSLTRCAAFGYDDFGFNPVRARYWEMFRRWHNECRHSGNVPYLDFPQSQRRFQAPEELCSPGHMPPYEIY